MKCPYLCIKKLNVMADSEQYNEAKVKYQKMLEEVRGKVVAVAQKMVKTQ